MSRLIRSSVIFAGAILTLATSTPVALAQAALPQASANASPNASTLTIIDDEDSYQIYSILLKDEMRQANIEEWAIDRETHTYYKTYSHVTGAAIVTSECLRPAKGQESIYGPIIEDYLAKNRTSFRLLRKFELAE